MSEHTILGLKWPKNTVLRVKTELLGGSLLETLPEPEEGTFKVKIGPEAAAALKSMRAPGETLQKAVERLIFEAAGHSR